MKTSTLFSVVLALIAGASARPAEIPTPTITPTLPTLSASSVSLATPTWSSMSSVSLATPAWSSMSSISLATPAWSSMSSVSLATPTWSSTTLSSIVIPTPTSTPTLGVRGLPIPSPPSNESQDSSSRGPQCSGDKSLVCCNKVKGLCNVLAGTRNCPVESQYCCDFSGNKGIQINVLSCSQVNI